MATIVNNPGSDNGSGSAGWAVAVIILLVVLVGGYFLWARHGGRTAAPSTNINVSLPTPSGNSGATGPSQ